MLLYKNGAFQKKKQQQKTVPILESEQVIEML